MTIVDSGYSFVCLGDTTVGSKFVYAQDLIVVGCSSESDFCAQLFDYSLEKAFFIRVILTGGCLLLIAPFLMKARIDFAIVTVTRL